MGSATIAFIIFLSGITAIVTNIVMDALERRVDNGVKDRRRKRHKDSKSNKRD